MERFLENAIYASRWLLAPVYFGLSLGLIALSIKFFQEIFHILPHIFSVSESDLILTLLSLVDMTLVGGLLVMVMFSVMKTSSRRWILTKVKRSSTGLAKWMRHR